MLSNPKVMVTQVLLSVFLIANFANATTSPIDGLSDMWASNKGSTSAVQQPGSPSNLALAVVTIGAMVNVMIDMRRSVLRSELQHNVAKLDCSNATTIDDDDSCLDYKDDVAGVWGADTAEFGFALFTGLAAIFTFPSIPVYMSWADRRIAYLAGGIATSISYLGFGGWIQKSCDDAQGLTVPTYLNNTDMASNTKEYKQFSEAVNIMTWANAAGYTTYFAGWTLKQVLNAERALVARYKVQDKQMAL